MSGGFSTSIRKMLEITLLRLCDLAYDMCHPIMGNLSLFLSVLIIYTLNTSALISSRLNRFGGLPAALPSDVDKSHL
jgi:hypothetical protein